MVTATATDALDERHGGVLELHNPLRRGPAAGARAVRRGGGCDVEPRPESLGVAGLIDTDQPTAGQQFDVEFYSVPECDAVATTDFLGTGEDFVTNERGIAGFAKEGLDDVDVGTAVIAVATRGDATSPRSNCVVADRSNTSWHNAHPLTSSDSEAGALRSSGQARWFKVPILPNSRVDVSLSNLPADYDIVVFSDIQQAYDRLQGTNVVPHVGPNLALTDLQREGAETQNDVFNTSPYDSSAWEPTNWDPNLNNPIASPSEWSPSEWSPSEWSASFFTPSEWSPSEWSPSEWSPSEWSPSEWSPSEWSPSEWSPSEWSDSQWSPSEWSSSNPADPRAFSSAQTASLLAVSAGPGTGDETLSVNTWNNTGHFYFRVQGKNGSFDADDAFSLAVERQGNQCENIDVQSSSPTALTGLGSPKTLILTDSAPARPEHARDAETVDVQLATLAARPGVQGVVVDVDADLTVRSLNEQADDARIQKLSLREEPRRRRDQAHRERVPEGVPVDPVPGGRRRRLGDPVLPLSGSRAPRNRADVPAAGGRQHDLAGEPQAELHPERRLHGLLDEHRTARQAAAGDRPLHREAGRDAGRDRGHARCVSRSRNLGRRADADVVAHDGLRLPHGRRRRDRRALRGRDRRTG